MIVICLEGCHGSGKTELCNRFRNAGYMVLDEAFLDMPEYALHPQSLLMETTWVCTWFSRLLKMAQEMKPISGEQVFIADRSPYSAVFYAAHGKLLEPVIREQMREVRASADIEIYTVHVKVAEEVLWRRIRDRLQREPGRAKYNEGKRSWMEQTLAFYTSFKWDLHVENNEDPIEKVQEQLVSIMCRASPRFESSLRSGWHLERHVTEQRERLSRRQSRSRSGSSSGECASPGEERVAPKAATPIVASTVNAPEVSPASTVATASLPNTPYGQGTPAQQAASATRSRRTAGLPSRPRPSAGEDETAVRRDMPAEKRGRDSRGNVVVGSTSAVVEEEEEDGDEEDSVDKLRPALTGEVGAECVGGADSEEARQVSKRLASAFEPISEEV